MSPGSLPRRAPLVLHPDAVSAMLAKKRRMSDLQQQLAELRQRVASIASNYTAKYEAPEPTRDPLDSPTLPRPAFHYIEEWLTGSEIETEFGRHFETEKLYEHHRRHGSADIGALADLPHDLLDTISSGQVPAASPEEWAFLDTETTGLAGGTGTCAFLVGVGRITREGFHVRQFFMRDYGEEASLLDALTRHLAPFRVLITYNGRAFDQPLLETRYRLNRARPPFSRLEHLDLLYGARRLWKLRFESCRLVDLENQVLGVERHGDLPGALIPYVYFEYLRTRQAARMLPVFQHNATDILTLACLTGIVPYAFKDAAGTPLKHGAEMAGIARWLREAGRNRAGAAHCSAAPSTRACPTICCSGRCGTSRCSNASMAQSIGHWRGGAISRRRGIRSAFARSKSWPSITSTRRKIMRKRSNAPAPRSSMKTRRNCESARKELAAD